MVVNVEIPEELAVRLHPIKDRLPEIIELGVRELNALNQSGYSGAAEVLEFLAKLPEPEEIVKLRPSQTLQTQISELLEKNRNEGLTDEEEEQWQRYEYLEHLVRLAKAEAMLKLRAAGPNVKGFFYLNWAQAG